MKYTLVNKRWGEYKRKLREDHVDLLYLIYNEYGLNPWKTHSDVLPKDRSKRNYFLDRMKWTFGFIDSHVPTKEERNKLLPNEKQMKQYKITLRALKIFVQLEYDIKDEHIALVSREVLYKDL